MSPGWQIAEQPSLRLHLYTHADDGATEAKRRGAPQCGGRVRARATGPIQSSRLSVVRRCLTV
jgi:hypothetical protein